MARPWSKRECDTAARIWKESRGSTKKNVVHLIAKAIGRSTKGVEYRYRTYGCEFFGTERIDRRTGRCRGGRNPAAGLLGFGHAKDIPDDAFAIRDARAAARERRDLTSVLLGDPPPGFSALDTPPPPPRNLSPLSAQITIRNYYDR